MSIYSGKKFLSPSNGSLTHDLKGADWMLYRLRVVSNFGDGDCGAGEIHTRARESLRRRDAKGAPKIRDSNFRRSLRVASPRTFARACVYFARPIAIAKIGDYS